jgi:lipooligosaccharide transport system permease protein
VQSWVQVLPLTHAVALTRPLVAGGASGAFVLHLGILAGYAAATFYVAVALVRRKLLA